MKDNKNKIIILSIFALADILIFNWFPVKGIFQEILAIITFFLIAPFILLYFVLKEEINTFYLRIGDYSSGIKWSFISLVLVFLIFYIIFQYTGFLNEYRLPGWATTNFLNFILYEFLAVFFLSLIFEIFFRGFIMFKFSKIIGYLSILLQWLFFLVLVFFNLESISNLMPYIIFFPFAGWIAYKSESILYSLTAQFIFIFMVDVFFIKTGF